MIDLSNREVIEAKGLRKFFGLMFRSRDSPVLIFNFKKPDKYVFTSWFVFFPFTMQWFDENNNLIDEKEIKPFTTFINPPKNRNISRVIEIPILDNKKGGDKNGFQEEDEGGDSTDSTGTDGSDSRSYTSSTTTSKTITDDASSTASSSRAVSWALDSTGYPIRDDGVLQYSYRRIYG